MESSESVASFASVTTVTGSVVESSLSDCEGSREAANSVLSSKLRAQKRSDLTRKRKIRQNQSMRVESAVMLQYNKCYVFHVITIILLL